MASEANELASLDFESLIGGPLVAVVNAQAQSAIATVNFIKSVGFQPPDEQGSLVNQQAGKPATVTFEYSKDSDGAPKDYKLQVPFLAMLPVPYLRVQETDIAFLAKIHSVKSRQVDTSFKIDATASAKSSWAFGGAKFKVSTSYQRQTKDSATITRDYSMSVKVKAVQEEMPAGLERLLGILESLIKEEPKE